MREGVRKGGGCEVWKGEGREKWRKEGEKETKKNNIATEHEIYNAQS